MTQSWVVSVMLAANVHVTANEQQTYNQANATSFLVKGDTQIDFLAMRNTMRMR